MEISCNNCGATFKTGNEYELIECPYCKAGYLSDKAVFASTSSSLTYSILQKMFVRGLIAFPMLYGRHEKRYITRFFYHLFKLLTSRKAHYEQINSRIKHQTFISLQNKKLKESTWILLSYLKNLQILDLIATNITDHRLRYCKGLTKLKEIYLSNTKITDKGIKNITGLKNLETLYLDNTLVTENGLELLIPQKTIQSTGIVSMSEQKRININYLLKKGGAHLFSNIDNLYLNNQKVQDDDLKYLKNFPRISRLYLENNLIEGKGLKNLMYCRSLERLYLDNNPITDEITEYLIPLKRLTEVHLFDTKIMEDDCRLLASKLTNCKIISKYTF